MNNLDMKFNYMEQYKKLHVKSLLLLIIICIKVQIMYGTPIIKVNAIISEMTLNEWVLSNYDNNVTIRLNTDANNITISGTKDFNKFVAALTNVIFIAPPGFNNNVKIVPDGVLITTVHFENIYNSQLCKDIGVNLSGWINCTCVGISPSINIINTLFQLEKRKHNFNKGLQQGNNCTEMIINFADLNDSKITLDHTIINVLFYTFGFSRSLDKRLKITNFVLNDSYPIQMYKHLETTEDNLSLTQAFEFIGKENVDYIIKKIKFTQKDCIQTIHELCRFETKQGISRFRIQELIKDKNIVIDESPVELNIADAIDENGEIIFWTEEVVNMCGDELKVCIKNNYNEDHPRYNRFIKITKTTLNKVIIFNKCDTLTLSGCILSDNELTINDGKLWQFNKTILDITRMSVLNNSGINGSIIFSHKLEALVCCISEDLIFLGHMPSLINTNLSSYIIAEDDNRFRRNYYPESLLEDMFIDIKIPIKEYNLRKWIDDYRNAKINIC